MTYQEITNRLQRVYDTGEARALARMVLDECFRLSLTDIMCDKVNDFSEHDNETLEKIIVRLENHEPIQYILGYADFCGHRFHVEPGVLIPRPETEELVEEIKPLPCPPLGGGLSQEPHHNNTPSLEGRAGEGSCGPRGLDIGTGSGCIAISIALAHPEIQMEAWDISDDALRIASDNAQRLGAANVTFRKVDVLKPHPGPPLGGGLSQEQHHYNTPSQGRDGVGPYSFIVSNPPYICQSEAKDMEKNVLEHEPHIALFVPDDDPLLFYRAIARLGTQTLMPGGWLFFEINRAYGNEVCEMMHGFGYTDIQLIDDQFGNPRIVKGCI